MDDSQQHIAVVVAIVVILGLVLAPLWRQVGVLAADLKELTRRFDDLIATKHVPLAEFVALIATVQAIRDEQVRNSTRIDMLEQRRPRRHTPDDDG